jgi:hypothetical protein
MEAGSGLSKTEAARKKKKTTKLIQIPEQLTESP